jgi:hypothetical protein
MATASLLRTRNGISLQNKPRIATGNFDVSGERGIPGGVQQEFKRSLKDAPGRFGTPADGRNRLIRKRPGTSRRTSSPCQGGCRGFDPRFPLQPNSRGASELASCPAFLPRASALASSRKSSNGSEEVTRASFRRARACRRSSGLRFQAGEQDARKDLIQSRQVARTLGIRNWTLAKRRRQGRGPRVG